MNLILWRCMSVDFGQDSIRVHHKHVLTSLLAQACEYQADYCTFDVLSAKHARTKTLFTGSLLLHLSFQLLQNLKMVFIVSVDFLYEIKCFLIITLAQIEHDGFIFNEQQKAYEHEKVDENWENVDESPECVIDISLLCGVIFWIIY